MERAPAYSKGVERYFVSVTKIILILFFGVCSAPTVHPHSSNAPIQLDLLRGNSLTRENLRSELFHSIAQKSMVRAQILARGVARANYPRWSIQPFLWPLTANAGDFVTTIELGTPLRKHTVVVDTGSDLMWVQCEPCSCSAHEDDVFDPGSSSSFNEVSCSSELCTNLLSYACDTNADCLYGYQYGDGSFTIGNLANETLTLRRLSGEAVGVQQFTFGCAHTNSIVFPQGGARPSGILGLGRGKLSIVNQISKQISGKFLYCLVDWYSSTTASSPLILGYQTAPQDVQYTALLVDGPSSTYYYVGLEGISVAGKRLSIPTSVFQYTSSEGGSILDSGTALTFLPSLVYAQIKQAVAAHVFFSSLDPSPPGFDLCYSSTTQKHYPRMVFHFSGDANMEVPVKNYMVEVQDGTFCLAMAEFEGTNFTIIGNLQQQNFQFYYDLINSRVGFRSVHSCSSLY